MLLIDKLTNGEARAVDMLIALASSGQKHGNADVGAALGVTRETAKHYVARAMEKVGVFNRIDLVMLWRCPVSQAGLKGLGIRH